MDEHVHPGRLADRDVLWEEHMGDLRVTALQRDFESLLKLLGGTPEERLRFWEILKGITTPAVFQVVEAELGAIEGQLKSTHAVLGALKANAKELSGQRAAV